MNAKDCIGFEDAGCFLGVVGNWDKFSGNATYLVVLNSPIGRLEGASDILYIGQSGRFGGDSSSRLWTYCHPTKKNHPTKITQEDRVMKVVGNLTSNGVTVSLHVCQEPPDGQTVKEYESQLLSRYETEHWELPPCNFQR
jgi:hypothetical protein